MANADEDDKALMDRLAALEAEVKADADAQNARKEAARKKVAEQRATARAEKDELRERQSALVKRKKDPEPEQESDPSDLSNAIELASKANQVKKELTRKGAKSWWKSGLASTALGPIGWLYAGSFREAIPASAIWIVIATILSKIALPSILLMPLLLVILPLSGIAGIVYATQFNKHGKRQRLFDGEKKKLLESGQAKPAKPR